jgi:hypothetical protein
MKAVWVISLAALAMGCTSTRTAGVVVPIPAGGGTTYHLILGFGVVRVNDANPSAAVVTDAQSWGPLRVEASAAGLGEGEKRDKSEWSNDSREEISSWEIDDEH